MINLTLRTAFRGLTAAAIILIAFAAWNLSVGAAFAGKVVLSGTYSPSQIKAACGADFVADGAAYGCEKTASDGTKTSVTCNWDGQCQGSCKSCGPAIAHRKNPIFGILSGNTLKAVNIVRPGPGSKSTHDPIVRHQDKAIGDISHSNKKN